MDGLLSFVIIIAGAAITVVGIGNLIFIKDDDEKSLKRSVIRSIVKIIVGLAIASVGAVMLHFSFFSI